MPRSTTTSRVLAEATIATGDIPASSGDTVTVALTVPSRGYIHRATMIWGRSSAWGTTADAGGVYLHTSGAAGAGTTLTSAQAQTIVGQSILNPVNANVGGAQLALGSGVYVFAPVLDFATGMKNTASGVAQIVAASGGGPTGLFYDASGTTLGPTQGTSTLYLTWIGGSDLTTNALFCKVRLEIEPVA